MRGEIEKRSKVRKKEMSREQCVAVAVWLTHLVRGLQFANPYNLRSLTSHSEKGSGMLGSSLLTLWEIPHLLWNLCDFSPHWNIILSTLSYKGTVNYSYRCLLWVPSSGCSIFSLVWVSQFGGDVSPAETVETESRIMWHFLLLC
jgi:hypothetical protein